MCKTDKKSSLHCDTYEVRIDVDECTEMLVADLTDRLRACLNLYIPGASCELTGKRYKRGSITSIIYVFKDDNPDNVSRFTQMFDLEWNPHQSTQYKLYPYRKYIAEDVHWSRDIGQEGETFMRSEVSQVTAYSVVHPEKYRPALYDTMASWMAIRCIVDDSNEALVKHILYGLNFLCKKIFPGVEVVCSNITDYWKIDKAQDIVFRLITDKKITLEEMCTIAPLSWHPDMEDVWLGNGVRQERMKEVFWSHFGNPNEVFITPELTWIHMYEFGN